MNLMLQMKKNLETKNDNNIKEFIEKIDDEELNNYKNIISTDFSKKI